jgi:hypothetical protein
MLRARIQNGYVGGSGSAGLTFNYVDLSNSLTLSIHPGDPYVSATIYSISSGGITTLASCAAGRVLGNTWYILDLRDSSSGLIATVFDDAETTVLCTMQVNGRHITTPNFGVVAVRAGGRTLVDWIETQ